jgi:hypothetical protein
VTILQEHIAEQPTVADAPRRRRRGPYRAAMIVAVAAWVPAVMQLDVDAVGPGGLLPVLPVAFFVALVAIVVAFIAAAADVHDRWTDLRLGASVVSLVVLLHGTIAALTEAPRTSWVYKHIGITDYIAHHGSVNLKIDIYHNYPGFFAAAASLMRAAGLGDPVMLARWSTVVFTVIVVLAIRWVAAAFLDSPVERWLPSLLFVPFYWDYNIYFAPQAAGLILGLGIFGLLLHRGCDPRRLRRSAELDAPPDRRPSLGTGDRVVVLLAFTCIVISHQISPFLIIAITGVLVVFARLRPRWLLLAMIAIAGSYTALRYSYLRSNYAVTGHIGTSNVVTPGVRSHPPWSVTSNIYVRGALAITIVALAGIGVLWCLRHRERFIVAALSIVAVSAIVVVHPYGGEAILRAYLFSLPFLGILAARPLARVVSGRPRWRRGRASVGLLLVASTIAWIVGYYGLDYTNVFTMDEVEASRVLYESTPPGSIIVSLGGPRGAGFFPRNAFEGYTQRRLAAYQPVDVATPDLDVSAEEYVASLSTALGQSTSDHPFFVVLFRGMVRRQAMLGGQWYGAEEYREVHDSLLRSPSFEPIFDTPSAWVFAFQPSRSRAG